MTKNPTVAAGVAALSRLRRGNVAFEDWLAVAKALAVGRSECMRIAGCSTPLGATYDDAMDAWLARHGLPGIGSEECSQYFELLKNFAAIKTWRDGADYRRKISSLDSVLCKWRVTLPTKAAPSRHLSGGSYHGRHGKPIFLPQDMLARAADAIRESRSQDFIIMARVALEAAIRGEADLAEITGARGSSPQGADVAVSGSIIQAGIG